MDAFGVILAATDLSPRANRAARRGAQLARAHGAVLHLAVVLSESAAREPVDGPGAAFEELAALLHRHYGVDVRPRVLFGRPHEALVRTAGELAAGLMVVGAHGEGFLRELLLGSTAFHLLRHCGQPVLVVKNDVLGPYENVLVGVDLSSDSGCALSTALALAPRATCTALYAAWPTLVSRWTSVEMRDDDRERHRRQVVDDARAELAAFLAALPAAARVQPRVEYGQPAKLLLERTWQGRADLVVVAKHGRGSTHPFELGSTSRCVVEAAEADVLLVPGGE